jgi:hypothetical protein
MESDPATIEQIEPLPEEMEDLRVVYPGAAQNSEYLSVRD